MKEWFVIFGAIVIIMIISGILSFILDHWAYYVVGGILNLVIIIGMSTTGGDNGDSSQPSTP